MRYSILLLLFVHPVFAFAAEPKPFAPEHLTAWCIVPFDAKKRDPEERVAMLKRLGFTRYAYDWRAEHLPTLDKELELLRKENITLQGVWFPANIGPDGETILALLKKHKLETELWVMLPQPDGKLNKDDKVQVTAALLTALAKKVATKLAAKAPRITSLLNIHIFIIEYTGISPCALSNQINRSLHKPCKLAFIKSRRWIIPAS